MDGELTFRGHEITYSKDMGGDDSLLIVDRETAMQAVESGAFRISEITDGYIIISPVLE